MIFPSPKLGNVDRAKLIFAAIQVAAVFFRRFACAWFRGPAAAKPDEGATIFFGNGSCNGWRARG